MSHPLQQMELYAWVGEDEFGSGAIGLKIGRVPAGEIPLVATTREKVDQRYICDQLSVQSAKYGKTIFLVRFVFVEVVKVA